MKKLLAMLCLVCLFLGLLPMGTLAAESGTCGEGLSWSFDSGTLTISGSGEMDDYTSEAPPWAEHRHDIKKVVFTGGITYIGANSFTDYDEIEAVEFGAAMHTIGEQAFYLCDGLTSIVLPDTFRCFGKESFMGCQNLESVYCLGGMPSFRGSCLWDTYTTVFFPTTNAWPGEYVQQLLESYQFKITIQPGTAPVQSADAPVQETEPVVTEAPTVPETTMPAAAEPVEETLAPAVQATQAPEQVPTEIPTEAPTEPPRMTEPEWLHETYAPEEPEEKDERGSLSLGLLVGVCIVSGILLLLLIGALVFRRRSY